MRALKRVIFMIGIVHEVPVDAQNVHHPHACNLSVKGATDSQLDPRWSDRICPTPQRGVLSNEQLFVSWSGVHVRVAHSRQYFGYLIKKISLNCGYDNTFSNNYNASLATWNFDRTCFNRYNFAIFKEKTPNLVKMFRIDPGSHLSNIISFH